MLTFDHPRNDRKNRKGKTILIDFGPDMLGWTGRSGLQDLLEACGQFIDYAKLWTMNAVLLPQDYIQTVVQLYKNAGIQPFAGGILFEYAWLKNDVDGLVKLLKYLGLDGIEVSENYLELSQDERRRVISALAESGLQVVYEFGRKNPLRPMELDEIEEVVYDSLNCGAEHVIMEQCEFDLLEQQDAKIITDLKARDWFEQIFIEVGYLRFPEQHADLITRFGADVNLANITPGQVMRTEGLRRGLGRPIDFPLIRNLLTETC